MVCPALLDQPGVDALFAPDAIARATRLVHPNQGVASSLPVCTPWLNQARAEEWLAAIPPEYRTQRGAQSRGWCGRRAPRSTWPPSRRVSARTRTARASGSSGSRRADPNPPSPTPRYPNPPTPRYPNPSYPTPRYSNPPYPTPTVPEPTALSDCPLGPPFRGLLARGERCQPDLRETTWLSPPGGRLHLVARRPPRQPRGAAARTPRL